MYEPVAYDQANKTQMVELLYTFMERNGGTGKTTRRMGIQAMS